MALIPPFYLDCVVAIGNNQNGMINWIATGFMFGYRENETQNYSYYLVSNKHVFQGFDTISLKFNPQSGQAAKDYQLVLRNNGHLLYKEHPNPNVDIAVLSINIIPLLRDQINFQFFRSDADSYRISDLRNLQVTEGDGVFALGYPMGNVGQTRQYAILRSGSIARVRDMLEGYSTDFMIDAFTFPGNSGGPVIIKPESIYINGTIANSSSRLIGVVKSSISYLERAVSRQTGRERIIFEDNTGLTNVEPVDRIIETINQS